MDSGLLSREVLCIMDIRQIQTYLFHVNSQEAVKGGDRMVKRILEDALAWAVGQIDPPLAANQVDLTNRPTDEPIPWFRDPHIQVQMINSVAGNATLLFRTGDLCQKVLHKVSRYVLEQSYGLDFAAAAVAKKESLSDDINSLYDRLGGLFYGLYNRLGNLLHGLNDRLRGFLRHSFNFLFHILSGGGVINLECCHLSLHGAHLRRERGRWGEQ